MAMTLGKPVLVSDLPAMVEVVKDGKNGFTFARGDKDHLAMRLSAILEDRELECVGIRGRKHVLENHDWLNIGQRTCLVYKDAAG
jgi:glycosyltransferase involved in cell wall biosynthesis